jgi:hypothetical protein
MPCLISAIAEANFGGKHVESLSIKFKDDTKKSAPLKKSAPSEKSASPEKSAPPKKLAPPEKEPQPSFGHPAVLKVGVKEKAEFVREPTTEKNKGWGVKDVSGKKQMKQPIAGFQPNDYKEGSRYTLLEYKVGRKNVRVLGVGTYQQAKLEDGPYNEKDGLTIRTGFSPFTHVVYLEVL